MTNLTEEQKLYIKLHKQHVTTQQGLKEVFYKVPKIFWLGELYQGLSLESKIAYGILEERKNVSNKNKWYDEKGKIYFIYTIEEFQQMLHVSKQKAINIKTELIKYGLLEQTNKVEDNQLNYIYLILLQRLQTRKNLKHLIRAIKKRYQRMVQVKNRKRQNLLLRKMSLIILNHIQKG